MTTKKRDKITTRIGDARQKITGDSYEQLMELCEIHDREPSDLIRHLIKKEHERTHRKTRGK